MKGVMARSSAALSTAGVEMLQTWTPTPQSAPGAPGTEGHRLRARTGSSWNHDLYGKRSAGVHRGSRNSRAIQFISPWHRPFSVPGNTLAFDGASPGNPIGGAHGLRQGPAVNDFGFSPGRRREDKRDPCAGSGVGSRRYCRGMSFRVGGRYRRRSPGGLTAYASDRNRALCHKVRSPGARKARIPQRRRYRSLPGAGHSARSVPVGNDHILRDALRDRPGGGRQVLLPALRTRHPGGRCMRTADAEWISSFTALAAEFAGVGLAATQLCGFFSGSPIRGASPVLLGTAGRWAPAVRR